MAVWQNAKTLETWDDGETKAPGDEGFSADKAMEHFGKDGFNYCGSPNWLPTEE